jgi:glutamate-ammonia-ligase adenylyltransferase
VRALGATLITVLARASPILDRLLAAGPDPEGARPRLERLVEAGAVLPEDEAGLRLLAALVSSGSFLTDLLLADADRLSALLADPFFDRAKPRERTIAEVKAAVAGCTDLADVQRRLRRYRQVEMLRLGVRELRPGTSLEVARDLSALADACLDAAVVFCESQLRAGYSEPVCADECPGFVVVAMGKLGGEELNFSSDVDLIYIYSSDEGQAGSLSLHEYYCRLSQMITRAVAEITGDGFVFRVDLRLRPEGGSGAICNSLAAAESYYETFGRTWERQALLRARPAAGDRSLGARFLKTVEPFVFPRSSGPRTLDEVRSLRQQFVDSTQHLGWNVKLGQGGIRDVELVAQALQLLYGGKRPDLRERATLPALHKLGLAGLLTAQEVRTLSDAYHLWRAVEHRIQLEQGAQTHELPVEPSGRDRLARRLGLAGFAELDALVEQQRRAVSAVAATLGEPEQGPSAVVLRLLDPALPRPQLLADLQSCGFSNAEGAAETLELVRGRLAPIWLEEAIASPNPDRALDRFRDLSVRASTGLEAMLREDRQLLTILAALFGTSERLSRHLLTHPATWPGLLSGPGDPRPDPMEWQGRLPARLAGCDYEEALREMRRFQGEEILRIGLHDVAGNLAHEEVSAQLGLLAETCLAQAVIRVAAELETRTGKPDAELTILVLGSCGAREMRYGSDLELVFLYQHEGVTPSGIEYQDWFGRLAKRLISALGALLDEGRLYNVDTRLRPSGSQGLLVTTYQAFEDYHHESAAPWERMALLRARPAFVLPGAGAPSGFDERLERIAYQTPPNEDSLRTDLLHLRQRIESERAGDLSESLHLRFAPGGLTDLEFLAAWGQLRHGEIDPALRTTHPPAALQRMVERGELVAGVLDDYRFLQRAGLRLRLLRDQHDDRLQSEDRSSLARSLGMSEGQLSHQLGTRMARVRAEFFQRLG